MSKNAVDEFLALKKTAGFGDSARSFGMGVAKNVGKASVNALTAGAAAAAAGGIGLAVSHIVDAATKSHDFKQMLAANEGLHEHYARDPKKFNMMFSTLRTMNPTFSKDPLIAGAWMLHAVDNPMGIVGHADLAAGANRNFGTPLQELFAKGVSEGVKPKAPPMGGSPRPEPSAPKRPGSESSGMRSYDSPDSRPRSE